MQLPRIVVPFQIRRGSVKEAVMQIGTLEQSLLKLIRVFSEAGKAFRARRAAVNELANCSELELACVAQDLGISTADLRVLASRDKTAADLLYRRLESLQLDPTSIDPILMRDLQRCCSSCDSKQLCAHELEDKPKGASWPKYCPNEQTIAALTTKPISPN
jgi:uncharacterized protein DUF6455